MRHGRRIAKKYNLTCEDCVHKYSRCYDEELCYSCVDKRKFELKGDKDNGNYKKEHLRKWMSGS